MCAWQAYLQLWTNSRGGEGAQDSVGRAASRRNKLYGNGRPVETPDFTLHNATKEGDDFLSEYFLIFIRYIFKLNWNLSGCIF